MKHQLFGLLGLSALCTVASGCFLLFGPPLQGSGVAKTETRQVPPFHSVDLAGSGEVKIEVGQETSVQVTIDDNLLENVVTDVSKGGVLKIHSRKGYSTRLGLKVKIVTKQLDAITVSGSGDVEATQVASDSMKVQITGSGSVTASGSAEDLSVKITGSGDARLSQLKAQTTSVGITGSGDAKVHTEKDLSVRITGSGDVTYSGTPDVSSNITGSGNVSQK